MRSQIRGIIGCNRQPFHFQSPVGRIIRTVINSEIFVAMIAAYIYAPSLSTF